MAMFLTSVLTVWTGNLVLSIVERTNCLDDQLMVICNWKHASTPKILLPKDLRVLVYLPTYNYLSNYLDIYIYLGPSKFSTCFLRMPIGSCMISDKNLRI